MLLISEEQVIVEWGVAVKAAEGGEWIGTCLGWTRLHRPHAEAQPLVGEEKGPDGALHLSAQYRSRRVVPAAMEWKGKAAV
jgi:hypothetical protein